MSPPHNSPPRLISVALTVLLIVFTTEAAVMFLLPVVVPRGVPSWMENLFDAGLLTTIVATLLFRVLIAPLRRIVLEEQAKAASIFQTAADGIITVGPDGLVRSCNRAAEEIFHEAAGRIIGQPLATIIPDDLSPHGRATGGVPREDGWINTNEYRFETTGLGPGGKPVPLAVSVSEAQVSGELLQTLILRDLTESERYQTELAKHLAQQGVVVELGQQALACDDELEGFLREVAIQVGRTLGVAHVGIFRRLHEGDDLQLCAGLGWERELVGRAIVPAAALPALAGTLAGGDGPSACEWPAALAGKGISCLLDSYGFTSGMMVIIPGSARPFGVIGAFATGDGIAFSTIDVNFLHATANVIASAVQRRRSELRRRERDVLRAERMAAVAQVAAGVAHEIRNPLTAVKLLVQSAQEEGAPGLPAQDRAIIIEEIRRMEASLKTLLDFARPPALQRRRQDLRDLARRTVALVRGRAARQEVRLELDLPTTAVLIDGDPEQIQQLLLNLALNALDEMPDGGTLEIGVRAGPNGGAELRVRDTGPGIKPEFTERLFDAFVTGKETGVGLGLAISRRIAEQHGGTLTASNRPEGGACFILRLPPREPANPAAEPSPVDAPLARPSSPSSSDSVAGDVSTGANHAGAISH